MRLQSGLFMFHVQVIMCTSRFRYICNGTPFFSFHTLLFTLELSKYKRWWWCWQWSLCLNDVVTNSTLLEEVLLSKRVMFDFICYHVLDRHVRTMTSHNKIAQMLRLRFNEVFVGHNISMFDGLALVRLFGLEGGPHFKNL